MTAPLLEVVALSKRIPLRGGLLGRVKGENGAGASVTTSRHRERGEAIQPGRVRKPLDGFASLAMTPVVVS
jgi:hypothetical protein